MTEPGLSDVDIEEIKTYASRIVRDMAELDIRVQDGLMVSSLMSMLADDYFDLRDDAVPPGADPADYRARCQTLGQFAEMAADDYYDGDDLAAYARYQVIKKETGDPSTVRCHQRGIWHVVSSPRGQPFTAMRTR